MLLIGYNALVNDFIHSQGGGYEHPSLTQTFGYLNSDGQLVAGISYHSQHGPNMYGNIAVIGNHLPKNFLITALAYPFRQLALARLTFFVAASNLKSIQLVEKLGAYREATLQDGCADGDVHIYCLRPARCKIWSIANGKERRLGSGRA